MTKQYNKSLSFLWVYFVLVAISFILLWPVIGKQASFCITPDNRDQAYPFFYKLATSLHKGYFPAWDANTYGGSSFAGGFISGIFYPLNILWCLLFGSERGIDVYYLDLLVALHYFICLFGMYNLGRVLTLSKVASITSAVVFTFTGVLSTRANGQTCIFFGLALLPWAIYFIGKYYTVRNNKKYLIFSGLIGGLQILAGHIQPFFHTVLIIGLITAFYEYKNFKSWKSFLLTVILNLSIIIGFALLLALPQIYYGAEYMSQSYRWVGADNPVAPGQKVPLSVYANKNLITLPNLQNLLGRDYSMPEDGNRIYMGILPLFLLIAWLRTHKKFNTNKDQDFLIKILLTILIIGILSSLGYLTFFHLILYNIPLFNTIRELGRYGILINFSASLIAGLAISNIPQLGKSVSENLSKPKFLILLVLGANALYLVLFEKNNIPLKVSFPFFLSFLFFLFLMKSRTPLLIQILAIVFIFTDVYLNTIDYSMISSESYPTTFYKRTRIIDTLEKSYGKYRVMSDFQNEDLVRRNLGDVYNIQTKLGYCATMNKPYFDFMCAGWGLNSEVHDLMNIKYILTDKIMDSNFVFRDSAQHINLYERKNYYPRIYWKQQLGKRGQAIEEENKETIKQSAYSDLYQKVEVDCSSPDTLIISENYYPGWKCYDNGKRVTIYQASIKNYPPIFRSIALDKGHHSIEFKYNKVFYWF